MSSVRILIADDHDVVRRGLRSLLECQPGWVVVDEAVNGREALEAAACEAFDLILMDVQMPEMDGFEATRGIRESEMLTGHRTPIVAIYGPTLRVRSEPWRDRGLVTEAVEPGPLPCRPCDQRACAPGDFRCLTQITPEAVIAAAERALACDRAGVRTDAPAAVPLASAGR